MNWFDLWVRVVSESLMRRTSARVVLTFNRIQEIFRNYRLRKGTPLGDHAARAVKLVEALRGALETVDEGIRSADPEQIETATGQIKWLATEAIGFDNERNRIAERFGVS